MEYRKRNSMQHKVQLPTLLRIVMAGNKANTFIINETESKSLVKELAMEAMESLNNSDHAALVEQTIF